MPMQVLCAGGCGKKIRGNRSSLPEGQRTCHPCRRSRPHPRHFCRCGAEVFGRRWLCDACRGVQHRGSTTQRGYGSSHQRARKFYLSQLVDGETECHWCGNTMYRSQPLDLDHTDDRKGYRGLAHAWCNRAKQAVYRSRSLEVWLRDEEMRAVRR
jgi:hypothetical protein